MKKLDTGSSDRFVKGHAGLLGLGTTPVVAVMQPTEGLDSHITAVDSLRARLQKPDAEKKRCFVRGLTPPLRPFVMREDPKSFAAAVQLARLAYRIRINANASTIHWRCYLLHGVTAGCRGRPDEDHRAVTLATQDLDDCTTCSRRCRRYTDRDHDVSAFGWRVVMLQCPVYGRL